MGKKKSQIDLLNTGNKKNKLLIILLAILTATLALASLLIGQYGTSLGKTLEGLLGISSGEEATNIRRIIWNIRVPRTLASIAIGGILAVQTQSSHLPT